MDDAEYNGTTIPEVSALPTEDNTVPAARTSPIPVIPQLGVALLMLFLVFGVTYLDTKHDAGEDQSAAVRIEKRVPATDTLAEKQTAGTFEDMHLEARSAIVWDVATQKVLFNKNADDVRPLASVTKLMTALVAYELLEPNDIVTVSHTALMTEGDSGLLEGETFTVQNLTDLTLIESSNDGAVALAEHAGHTAFPQADGASVFVSAMNMRAQELGLTKTRYANSTGLDLSESEAGAYGSARDMAHLMEYLITKHPSAAALTTQSTMRIYDTDGNYHTVKNTNEAVGQLDGLIASKTGYTLLSGGNLVIAVDVGLNHPVVIAVLGSSTTGRFSDALALLKEARAAVAQE